jgi:protein-S-isoprenylcysteine O-methyltransferase Ste14
MIDLFAPTTLIGAALALLGIYYIVFWWSYWRVNYKGKLLTGGPYGIVRHPYYFGFLMLATGLVVIVPQVETAGLAFISWAIIISQIKTEEEALIKQYGNKYKEYQERVRYRLIPGVY